jgi:hypothetical protein
MPPYVLSKRYVPMILILHDAGYDDSLATTFGPHTYHSACVSPSQEVYSNTVLTAAMLSDSGMAISR